MVECHGLEPRTHPAQSPGVGDPPGRALADPPADDLAEITAGDVDAILACIAAPSGRGGSIPQSDPTGIAAMAGAAVGAFAAAGIVGSVPVVHFEQTTGMISPRGLWFQELLGLPAGLILDGGI
ncbi:hypothetical protein [Inquilinus sp. Marseille-Q2685]|uniref:hypothetical protein n=1 Tax=Inquilinus sp. Marseille-Q2685 TaxID=2866581 RepID=UPI001CE46668|nr:hypothetical protein [Inquilinus sp. Marseille-Q2685]